MSDVPGPQPAPPPPLAPPAPPPRHPGPRPGPPPPPPVRVSLLGCGFGISVLINIFAGLTLFLVLLIWVSRTTLTSSGAGSYSEEHYSGKESASDKIAIIRINGVLMEGMLRYPTRQIEQAQRDSSVKAVVVQINSPGGSVTASDSLHRLIKELRQGDSKKDAPARPVIASFGGLAASGGYYIAMATQNVFAENTTMTGSIGVFASFPDVHKLASDHGVGLTTIKQGAIKDSGNPFKEMTAEERQVWQDLIDHAYQQFVGIVEEGRPNLKGKLLDPLKVTPIQAGPSWRKKEEKKDKASEPYVRYRADGGLFTAAQAQQYGLIDQIGYLDDAIQAAATAANLGDNWRAIQYERPHNLMDLLGVPASSARPPSTNLLDPACYAEAAIPRIWYLAPGSELAGWLTVLSRSTTD